MTVPKRLRNDEFPGLLKIMINLDITERRRPQDGRIQAVIDGASRYGFYFAHYSRCKKIVGRVLNKPTGILSIEQFGFSQTKQLEEILRVLRLNQGLI